MNNDQIVSELQALIAGDVSTDCVDIDSHSRDTSLFQVKPAIVIFPKTQADVQAVVKWINEHKADNPDLSITGRSAGTDMTGGSLNQSIILSFTKYMNESMVDIENLSAEVEPGVFYRNFEKQTLPQGITLPCYPASKNLAALGGMVMNNSAGERTLRYGQMRNFVDWVDIVASDGNVYRFGQLSANELADKAAQDNFEGTLYRQMKQLIDDNYDSIISAKPDVSKNSAGYALWEIYDKSTDTFNLAQLFVGSQGTLGILVRAGIRLVTEPTDRFMVTVFLKSWEELPAAVNLIKEHDPEEIEVFDDKTMWLGIRFMPQIAKIAGQPLIKFAAKFLPEMLVGLRMLRMPKLVLLVEFAESDRASVQDKASALSQSLQKAKLQHRVIDNINSDEDEKYWTMRRESFALLRKHVGNKHTAPFVEDFCVATDKLPEFLPRAMKILKSYGITATIAGHAGNGNLHIIPLMDLSLESERAKIVPCAEEFYQLVADYNGSITAEHNDGILRTPFLPVMYGEQVVSLFQQVKDIFDPQNIFNPGKKVGGTKAYLELHITPFKN